MKDDPFDIEKLRLNPEEMKTHAGRTAAPKAVSALVAEYSPSQTRATGTRCSMEGGSLRAMARAG
jgi:hypothetical protein